MKISSLIIFGVAASILCIRDQSVQAAEIAFSEPVLASQGPNHRTFEKTRQVALRNGRFRTEKSVTVQLAAGANYRDLQTGELLPSKAVISPYEFGAIAHQGQIKCAFASDLKTRNALQISLDDGTLLSCNILGLGWVDSENGTAVMLAETKNCAGVIDSENTISWVDAMDGLRCSVRMTYHTWGVESDLILLESPNVAPEDYGMSSATTRWELYTEFNGPAQPAIQPVPISSVLDPEAPPPGALGKFGDVILDFSSLRFGEGKAFDLQGATPSVPVGKTWTRTADNRLVLIEQIEYPAIRGAINGLPKAQAALKRPAQTLRAANQGAGRGELLSRVLPPPVRTAQAGELRPMIKTVQTAQLGKKANGFLWDFVATLSSGLTNYSFRGDYTYEIAGPVTLYSTSHISGGAILKFDKNANAYLDFNGGTVVCDTSPYYPAVFTSSQDQTMGDSVAGGSASGFYATTALKSSTNVIGDLHDLRIKDAVQAIKWTGSTNRFSNIQIIHCSNGIERVNATNAPVHNVLAKDVANNLFIASNTKMDVQHLTADQVKNLGSFSGTPATLSVTNSILYNVTNLGSGTFSADYVATNTSLGLTGVTHSVSLNGSPFQTAVGGQHYIASSNLSLFNSGTTNIDANLLAELSKATVSPPSYYTNALSLSQTWSPVVQRDYDTPDYGYHSPAADYIVSGLTITSNAVLTLTNGVVVGVDYGASVWGIILDNGTLLSEGSPTKPNRVLRAHCFQETSSGNPGTRALFYDYGDQSYRNDEMRFRFTEMTQMAEDGYALYTGASLHDFEASHCTMNYMVWIIQAYEGAQTYGFTNNIFEWPQLNFEAADPSTVIHLRNNLFRNTRLDLAGVDTGSTVKDNIFDTSDAADYGYITDNGWNAYFGTSSYLSSGVSDTNLSTLTYEVGTLGKYYQPANSPLLDRGSLTNAGLVGLWWFTSTTNNVAETNSVLNIGNHYVATDGAGNPLDSDGDGIPNYQEDRNGDGLFNGSETDWQSYNSLFGAGSGPGLQVFTPLK